MLTVSPILLCRAKGRAGSPWVELRRHHLAGDGDILVPTRAGVPADHQGLGMSGLLPVSIFHRGQGCSWDLTLLRDRSYRNSQGQVSPFPGVTPFGDNQLGQLFSNPILQPAGCRRT